MGKVVARENLVNGLATIATKILPIVHNGILATIVTTVITMYLIHLLLLIPITNILNFPEIIHDNCHLFNIFMRYLK
tara:strand:- start:2873 stop:3103 length:231 start_codon:yes stop_codon:yes gene_type:complete